MVNEGDTKLSFKLEKMVQNLLNEFVVKDGFRVSTPTNVDKVKRIFGHALSQKQLNKLSGHDGIVVLFSIEYDESGKPGDQRTLKSGSVERRQGMEDKARKTVDSLEKYLGKPIVDVWEGMDQWKNIFGNRSIYVCCMFAMDESGFPNFVT